MAALLTGVRWYTKRQKPRIAITLLKEDKVEGILPNLKIYSEGTVSRQCDIGERTNRSMEQNEEPQNEPT